MSLFQARVERRHDNWRGAIDLRRFSRRLMRCDKRGTKVHDHLGKEFSSLKEMCKHWGISVALYFKRTALGYSLMRVLTTDVELGVFSNLIAGRNAIPATDHEGTTFKSKTEMCKHWGVSVSTFTARLKRGMSVKEALTTKSRKSSAKNKVSLIFKEEIKQQPKVSQISSTRRVKRDISGMAFASAVGV